MRTFFLATFLGLFLVFGFNFWIDPYEAWFRRPLLFEHAFACGQVSILRSATVSSRNSKLSLLENSSLSDLIILGSSRAMTFEQKMVQHQFKLLNLSFSGGQIDEYAAFWQRIKETRKIPKYLVIAIEPISFNNGARKGDFFWLYQSGYLDRFRREMGIKIGYDESINEKIRLINFLKIKITELVQWETLLRSIKQIYLHGLPKKINEEIVPESSLSQESAAYRCDGSLVYPKKLKISLENLRKEAIESTPDEPSDSYQYSDNLLDKNRVHLLGRIAQDAIQQGVQVMLLVSPIHPFALERLRSSKAYSPWLSNFYSALNTVASQAPSLNICNLLDLADSGCHESELLDAYHMDLACDRKVLDRCFSMFSPWVPLLASPQETGN